MDWRQLSIARVAHFLRGAAVHQSRPHARRRPDCRHHGHRPAQLVLLSDLVEGATQFTFTEQQLQAYGAFELQVLEELLRRPSMPGGAQVCAEVCDKICRRIGWTASGAATPVCALPARLLHR